MIARMKRLPTINCCTPLAGSSLSDAEAGELETALMENGVFKATLMRGTLHLVSAREFDLYRVASRFPTHIWSDGLKQLGRSHGDRISDLM